MQGTRRNVSRFREVFNLHAAQAVQRMHGGREAGLEAYHFNPGHLESHVTSRNRKLPMVDR
jgi:hypothetical protein